MSKPNNNVEQLQRAREQAATNGDQAKVAELDAQISQAQTGNTGESGTAQSGTSGNTAQ